MLISTEYPTSEFSIVFASDRNDGLVKVYVDGDLIEEYNTWANVDLTQPLEYQVIKTLKITGLEYENHNIKIVASGTNGDPNDVTIYRYGYNCPDTQVPEFPTIALPVAAIIGIAFIFQKRNEE
ncbi:PEF-CTERM sorting domain-containing protein [Methanolobus vulcani]|uniref:PEF-CTERM sorting domain-containing protein n=2 Tax=Methanolobus vulcani TaxID=38026 RepID=A0A7Z8P2Y2_9EURY|nr:PEF-CTERM sorting domain-containing protein [Methanolobus vulcani]